MDYMTVFIVAPSLDTKNNVSGVSAVTNFIISNNSQQKYQHFLQGKTDDEKDGKIYRVWRIIKNYTRWKSIVKSDQDCLIHYNFPLDAFSILRDYFFMRYAVKKHIPMVIHLHGGLYLFREKKPWIIDKMLKSVFSWPCSFIVLSKKEKDVIEKEYGTTNVEVLPNCVDLTDAKTFERENYNDETLHVLYLGRIEPNKGVDYMLSAAEKLKKRGVKFILHVAGKDQCKDYYVSLFQECLGENFVYEGIVTGVKKTELLKKCQVFLLPSFYEGLPMSLLEGMSFGEVPIVTNVGSIGEVVDDMANGLFVKVKDDDSIVDAIIRLDGDRESLRKLSNKAQMTIMEIFSPEEYIEQLNLIYHNSMSR